MAKKKKREHRALGGSIVRVSGRPGVFGQYRIDGKRYQVRLMQEDGKTPIAEDDDDGAEEALTEWVLKMRKKEPDKDGVRHVTLTEFLKTFYKLAASRVGERHMGDVRSRCDRAAKHFGATELHRIDKQAAETYMAKLSREDGRLEKVPVLDDDGKPVLDSKGKATTKTIVHPMTSLTRRNHRNALSTAWTAAMDRGFATMNPWRQVRLPRGQQFAPRLVTVDEVRRILDHVRSDVRPILEFMAETGVRLGEARDLTWLQVESGFGQFVVARSKSGRTRSVPCTVRAKATLETAWKGHVAKTEGPDYVFARHDRHFVWKHFRDACDTAGVEGRVRVHDLRHHVGTSLAQAGVPIPTIMGILGHSQIQTTQRYAAHLPANAAAQAFAALDAARHVTPPVAKTGS